MDLETLKSLITVAETGSFSRAATKLCVSQSAVSKRIKQLEEILAAPLLDRSGAQSQLTLAGEIVVKNAVKVLRICEQCSLEIASLRAEKKITFCCTPSYSVSHLSTVVKELMERRPDINNFSFTLHNLENIIENLNSSKCHLAVVEHCDAIPIPDELEAEPIDIDTMVFIAGLEKYPQTSPTISELMQENIYVRSGGCCSRKILENVLAEQNLKLDGFAKVFTCDDLNLNLRAVLAGEGIAFVPTQVASPYAKLKLLNCFPLEGFTRTITRSLLRSPSFFESKESSDLIAVIRNLASNKPCK